MKICQLTNSTEKQAVTRSILEALPEWFGIPEAREDYITESGVNNSSAPMTQTSPLVFYI